METFDCSTERQSYLDARGKVILNACPGSGKTTTIAHKLNLLLESGYKNSHSGIACLSFTNVAKEEIHEKYQECSGKLLKYPHLVSTLDSFINSYITLPFFYLLNSKVKRISVEPAPYLDNLFITDLWDSKAKKYKHLDRYNVPLKKKPNYWPSEIIKTVDNSYTTRKGVNPADVDPKVFEDYARTVKKWQADVGILTMTDSTTAALALLRRFPRQIGKYLTLRFGYLIIDEAQDTSEIQHEILDLLVKNGLQNIELIGDPYQTLYEWRDASPELFANKCGDSTWTAINLFENLRSTQPIIDCFSVLRKISDTAIQMKGRFEKEEAIHLIRFKDGDEIEAISKYKLLNKPYKSNHVVVRGNILAKRLNGNASQATNYWKDSLPTEILDCLSYFRNGKVKLSVDGLRRIKVNLETAGRPTQARLDRLKELKSDYQANARLFKILRDLMSTQLELEHWSGFAEETLSKETGIDLTANFELKQRVKLPDKTTISRSKFGRLKMKELFFQEEQDRSLGITTIHQVKGKTFDSIFLILNKNGLTLNSFVPQRSKLTENQAMMYVAMSRPRYLLVIGVDESIPILKLKTKFGSSCIIL